MIKFRYIIGNQSIETLNVNDIPEGVLYTEEVFEEIVEEPQIIIEPTKEDLLQTVQSLEVQLNDVKNKLNNL